MGDNKISEAAAQETTMGPAKKWRCSPALESAFAHLQGEAVPVAWIDLTKLSRSKMVCASAYQIEPSQVPVFNHPQPAELSEVSGGSGEVSVPKGWRVTPHTDPWRSGDRWEVYGPNGGGGVNEHDIQCRSVRGLLDALAATGKQQVGEVQGSDFDIDDVRELFEKHAKGRDLTPDTWGVSSYVDPYVDNDWNEWVAAWKAIASCQPVGAQAVDLGRFREAVRYASGVCPHEDLAAKLRELLALIDGRDAGAGVG